MPSPQGPNNLDTHVQKHQCSPYLPPDSKELRVQNLETQVIKALRENIGVAICDYDKAAISKIQCPKHQQQKTDNRKTTSSKLKFFSEKYAFSVRNNPTNFEIFFNRGNISIM